MADDNPPTPQAGSGGSDTPQPQAGTPPSEPQAGDEPISLDEAKKLRSEAKNLRERLKTFEKAEKDRQDAALSEQERLSKQYAELQAQHSEAQRLLQEERNYAALERAGRKLGIVEQVALDDAVKIALVELEHDEAGKPINADKAMEKIVKARPWLLSKQPQLTAGGATNPSRSAAGSFGEVTAHNVAELMSRYGELTDAQRQQVTNFLVNRRGR